MRTAGVLSSDLSAEEADKRLGEFGVRTFISAKDRDLTTAFVSDFSYDPLLEVNICGIDYTILRLPE